MSAAMTHDTRVEKASTISLKLMDHTKNETVAKNHASPTNDDLKHKNPQERLPGSYEGSRSL